MKKAKEKLRQHGANLEAIAVRLGSKNKKRSRDFYFNYEWKLGLEEILEKYKKTEGGKDGNQSDKLPEMVTDEEKSGEIASSCDEDDRYDKCSNDTACASSFVKKIIEEDKSAIQRLSEILLEANQTVIPSEEAKLRNIPQCEASPKYPLDYDTSATLSVDESENATDGDGLDPSPSEVRSISHNSMKMPVGYKPPRNAFQSPLSIIKEIEKNAAESNIPLVKLLQDREIGAVKRNAQSYIQHRKPMKEEPTCIRDLIYQAIEMSLEFPLVNPGRNSSLIPTAVSLSLDKDVVTYSSAIEPKKEPDTLGTQITPITHSGSRQPSRPSSHHMDIPPDFHVQDHSKKVKPRDVSSVKDFIKRDRVVTTVKQQSGSNSSSQVHYYNQPPPAHCNTPFHSSQHPPPTLSPYFVMEPHHDYYCRRDSRGKSYSTSEKDHSQPPHPVAQSFSLASASLLYSKPLVAFKPIAPPPPFVPSKPSHTSPKISYMERVISVPPARSKKPRYTC